MSEKLQDRITQLEAQLKELEARLPKHSTPPAMLMVLEDLEDELAELRARADREPSR
jgi:hypothetical protein